MTIDVQVNANTNPAIQALDRLGSKIESIQSKFAGSFDKMNVAATALGATLLALATSTAKFADDITDVAAANGLATAEVLAFQSALQSSGGKAENVGQALQRLSNAVDDANNGNIKAVSSFAKLGVSMSDLGSLSQSEIREKLLVSLSKIPDAMQRNAVATEFFGKSLIGVNLQKLIADERDARIEAEKYAPALETAAKAFESIEKIGKQIKLAFAEAFEPLFRMLGAIKLDTDLLVVGFRAMGAALIAITAAGVIRGVLALRDAFLLLNAVTSKNPLVALGTAAVGIASYIGLTKDATDATKELNKEAEKPKAATASRDQTGYNDLLEKQRLSISKSGQELQRGFDIARSKYDLDLQSLSLTEEQKIQTAARAKIEQDAAKAKQDAQTAFDALDKTSQATQRAFLDETLKGIDEKASREKLASDAAIAALKAQQDIYNQLNSAATSGNQLLDSTFKRQAAVLSETATVKERIALEQRMVDLSNIRASLMASVANVSQAERANATMAAAQATNDANMLSGSYDEVNKRVVDSIQNFVKLGAIGQDTANILIKGSAFQRQSSGVVSAQVLKDAQEISDVQRSFAQGWNKAFASYVDDATNASSQAQAIFSTATKGIEDAFVNLAKTGKLSFKTLLSDIAEQILRSNIKSLLSNVFTPTGGAGGGGFVDSLLSIGKNLLGFANGGVIPTNAPVLVGERGPEIISGAAGRAVTPNNQLGGTVVYNISAVDAASFKSLVARDPGFIHAVASQGARSVPTRR